MAADSADGADSAADSGECWALEGGGCHEDRPVEVSCERTGDTGTITLQDTGEYLTGDGCSCQAPGSPAWFLAFLALLLALLRRGAPLSLLLLALPARAIDAQHLQIADGGVFLTILEAQPGLPWSARMALGSSYATNLAVLRRELVEDPILARVLTTEAGASLALGSRLRLGASQPVHGPVLLQGEWVGPLRGDTNLWFMAHLSRPESPVQRAWTVAADVPNIPAVQALLGDTGAVRGIFTSQRAAGGLTLGGQAAVRLQRTVVLPTMLWGSRIELGGGASGPLFGWASWGLEAMASSPLGPSGGGRGAFPLEILATARTPPAAGVALRVGGGAGVGAGVGSPTWRAVVAVEADGIRAEDADKDGIYPPRDACPRRAEDLDGFHDGDGCPEPDNDRDEVLDAADPCPNQAETFNNYRDEDGCPDALAVVLVTVTSQDPDRLERAILSCRGETQEVLPGEPARCEGPAGERWIIEATAAGHRPAFENLAVPEPGLWKLRMELEPIYTGDLLLRAAGAGGAPLAASVADPAAEIPLEGALLSLPEGQSRLTVSAPGHLPADVLVDIIPNQRQELTVSLEPLATWIEEGEVRVNERLTFALNSAELTGADAALIDRLAAWLLVHPEIALLRVEGTADEPGSPAYNHRLSVARAQAVRDRLIAAGVAPERLEAIGSGEALARGASEDERSVRFLVLIWDEAQAPDAPAP